MPSRTWKKRLQQKQKYRENKENVLNERKIEYILKCDAKKAASRKAYVSNPEKAKAATRKAYVSNPEKAKAASRKAYV